MPTYELRYFNVKALGEPIRYMLSYMGQEFEDVRLPRDQWSPELKNGTPFGKLPTLKIGSEVYHDSVAICRYLATQSGLAGDNPKENLVIDQIVGAIGDCHGEIRKVVRAANDEEKAKAKKQLIEEHIPFYMKRFEETIKNNKGYLANGKLSWADLYFIAWSESLSTVSQIDLSQNYPHYKVLKETVQSNPGIKAWLQRRPDTVV